MNDLLLFGLFKWGLEHDGHTLNDTDADEIIFFVKELLRPNYIDNFIAVLKLYGVVMTDKELPYRVPLMRWFLDNIRKDHYREYSHYTSN